MKLSTVDTIDEEGEDILVRKITTEACEIPISNITSDSKVYCQTVQSR